MLPSWQPASSRPEITPFSVHIWRISLVQPVRDVFTLNSICNDQEILRAKQFYFQADQRRFTITRGALRTILSRYLHLPPETIQIQVTEFGKPYVHEQPIQFNASHSGEMAVVGITWNRPVGIDLEYSLRPVPDEEALVARYFSAHEYALYQSVPFEKRTRAFFNGWTRKESYIKALGEGLSHPLASFDVELRPGEPATFLNINQDPLETARWFLHNFTPATDYIAALATPGPVEEIRYFDWQL